MDTSLISLALGAQAGAAQTRVAASILKSNMDAEKAVVAALLDPAQNSSANLASGIGGKVDVSA